MKKILLLIAFILVAPSVSFGTTNIILTSAQTTNCQGETGTNCGVTSDSYCSGSVTYTSSVQPGGTVLFQAQDSYVFSEVGGNVNARCVIAVDGISVGFITELNSTGGPQSASGQKTYIASMNPGTYTFRVLHDISKTRTLQNNVEWSAWGNNISFGSFTVAQPASIQLNARAVSAPVQ